MKVKIVTHMIAIEVLGFQELSVTACQSEYQLCFPAANCYYRYQTPLCNVEHVFNE